MANKNFMEASTEVDGYVSKIVDIKRKIAGTIVEACESRSESGKVSNLTKDLDNMLKDLSESDRNDVYKEVILLMTKRMANPSSNRRGRRDDDDGDDFSSIFRNRGF